jgi:hypothetical protein
MSSPIGNAHICTMSYPSEYQQKPESEDEEAVATQDVCPQEKQCYTRIFQRKMVKIN